MRLFRRTPPAPAVKAAYVPLPPIVIDDSAPLEFWRDGSFLWTTGQYGDLLCLSAADRFTLDRPSSTYYSGYTQYQGMYINAAIGGKDYQLGQGSTEHCQRELGRIREALMS